MNRRYSISVVAVAASMLIGCASVPVESTMLNDANADYQAAASNPRVTKYAPVALKEAEEALRAVETLRKQGADATIVNHRAYLARQKVAIAVQQANLNAAEDEVAKARAERDKVILEARVHDAEKLRRVAEVRAREAELARQQAERAKGELESLSQELSALKARGTERGLVLTLGDVLFGFDRAELTSGGQRAVAKLSEFLRRYEKRHVMVEGFTDSIGSEAYNLDLSNRRANAVRLALIQRGIDPGRIRIHGYGKAYPVADNRSDAGRQQNRRVEIIISDNTGKIPARTQ